MDAQYNDYMTLWLKHFFKHATLVKTLPHGWCVYREALDWD